MTRWRWVAAGFVLAPLLEVLALLAVGRAVGGLATVLMLVATSAVGALVLRREGPAAWRGTREAVQAGRVPPDPTDAGLILAGGVLLLVPGFLSDVVGVVLLAPPTRRLVRRRLARSVAGRGGPLAGRPDGRVVRGEIVEPGDRPPAGS